MDKIDIPLPFSYYLRVEVTAAKKHEASGKISDDALGSSVAEGYAYTASWNEFIFPEWGMYTNHHTLHSRELKKKKQKNLIV